MRNHLAKLAGQGRHLLTAAAGAMVWSGIATEAEISSAVANVETMIGAAGLVIGLVLSWTSRAKRLGVGDPA